MRPFSGIADFRHSVIKLRFIGVTIEMSKTKRGAQSRIFSNWLLWPLDCFCSQYSANTSLHHFDHRNKIQGKINGRSAGCLELIKVDLLSC